MKNLKIGSHVSMSGKEMMLGSVKEAASYNSDTFMIYTGAPQNTRRKPIEELRIEEAHKLMEEKNISAIVEEFRNRTDKQYFSRYVDRTEIEENDYNLSVSTYVEKEDTREVIDIKVLNKEIEETVKKIDELRSSINEIVKELEDE